MADVSYRSVIVQGLICAAVAASRCDTQFRARKRQGKLQEGEEKVRLDQEGDGELVAKAQLTTKVHNNGG